MNEIISETSLFGVIIVCILFAIMIFCLIVIWICTFNPWNLYHKIFQRNEYSKWNEILQKANKFQYMYSDTTYDGGRYDYFTMQDEKYGTVDAYIRYDKPVPTSDIHFSPEYVKTDPDHISCLCSFFKRQSIEMAERLSVRKPVVTISLKESVIERINREFLEKYNSK